MAWPALTSDDVLSGEGAEELGQHLFDRDVEMSHGIGTTWEFADNTMSTALTTESTIALRVPDWMGNGAVFHMRVKSKQSTGGAALGDYILDFHDGSSWNSGTNVNTDPGASWSYIELIYTLTGDEGGNFRQLRVRANDDASGSFTISAGEMLRNLRFYAS